MIALGVFESGLVHFLLWKMVVLGEVGKSNTISCQFSDDFPELLVTKYKYHFIFYLAESMEKPVIIGVIHERRDIVKRLTERLT